ncbi:MAG TPA: ATP-binding protein [Blastocatellia bacterium]
MRDQVSTSPVFCGQFATFHLHLGDSPWRAWRGGLGPGLVATALSALVADYFFVKPYFVITLFDRLDMGVILFAAAGVFISWISEQRLRAEAQLWRFLVKERQARADAQTAVRAQDVFLATVSHELRTPLNAIRGWARILTHQAAENTTLLKALDVIERNAIAQEKLIEDLLDTARTVNCSLRLQVGNTELAAVVRSAIETVRPSAESKSIEIIARIASDIPSIAADPERLQQVVWNLLSNAIKFSPEGGKITIQLKRDGDDLLLAVSDTGQGIHEEFLPFVFDRFRQGNDYASGRKSGLGLGLHLAKSLVELHEGDIRADSGGPGKGATFTVRLPIRSSPLERAAPAVPDATIVRGTVGRLAINSAVNRNDDPGDEHRPGPFTILMERWDDKWRLTGGPASSRLGLE